MNRTVCYIVIALAVSPSATNFGAASQELSKCGSARVQYEAFDRQFSKSVVVQSIKISQAPSPMGEKQYSPQRTAWQVTVAPGYMKNGPWSTAIYLGHTGSDDLVKISLLDHGNGSVQVHWLRKVVICGSLVGAHRFDRLHI
jgi:hypothetical protein